MIESTSAGGGAGGAATHRRRHNDKYIDEISSLAYYGARYYDRLLIGWTQSDPLYRFSPDSAWIEPRRSSLYTFVIGNPLRYADPDGRDGVKCDSPKNCRNAEAEKAAEEDREAQAMAAEVERDKTAKQQAAFDEMMDQPWGDGAEAALGGGRRVTVKSPKRNPTHTQTPGKTKNKTPGRTDSETVNVNGKIYVTPGERTKSGKEYVGRTTKDKVSQRGNDGGRTRKDEDATGTTYSKDDVLDGKIKEQKEINARGGKVNLDNKRNEIAERYWEQLGIPPPNQD